MENYTLYVTTSMIDSMAGIFRFKLLVFICIGFCSVAVGQNEFTEALIEKYKDKSTINLLVKNNINISIENENLKIVQQVTEEQIFLTDKVSSALKESVPFSSFYKLVDLQAESYSPRGSKYKKNVVKDFKVNSRASGSVFYDDSKEKTFYFTNLSQGAKTALNYTMEITQPHLLSEVWMQSFYPCERIQFSITYPNEVDLGFKIFNLNEDQYDYTKIEKGGKTTLTWTRTDVEEMEYESDGPNPRFYTPQIHPYIKSTRINNENKNYLGSVQNLHHWYRELIKGYNKNSDEPNKELENIVDSLTSNIADEKQKVEKIFSWVQRNIKYIAFEYELAGFIPRPASKVCTRRFGDCKDMASIITEMLALANIKSHLTWIGTRRIPFDYEDIATPSVDNHMIATYFDQNGQAYFLDATDRYLPFGSVADHIQGKQALVSLSPTDYKVIRVPESKASFSTKYDSCYLTISKKNLKGNGYLKETGYYRNYATYRLSAYDDKEKLEYFKSVLQKGNNKFKLKNHSLKNLENYTSPIEVDYTFELPDYLQSYEDEIYIDLNLLGSIGTKIEKDREVAYNYRFNKEHKAIFVLEVPKEYEVTYIPDNYEGIMKDFHYSIDYTLADGKLIYEVNLNRMVMIMDKSYFEDWNKIIEDMNAQFAESIVLKKK